MLLYFYPYTVPFLLPYSPCIVLHAALLLSDLFCSLTLLVLCHMLLCFYPYTVLFLLPYSPCIVLRAALQSFFLLPYSPCIVLHDALLHLIVMHAAFFKHATHVYKAP
jgi:hypothetical protein